MADITSDSPFDGDTFLHYELLFSNVIGTSGTIAENEYGNPVIVTSPGEPPIPLVVKMNPTSKPTIVRIMGADGEKIAFEGRCVDPMYLPSQLIPGAKSPLSINGVDGVFTLGPATRGSVLAAEEALGQPIIGVWASSNHPQGT